MTQSFVLFNKFKGKTIYVNPQKVAYLEPGHEEDTTLICFSGRKDDWEKVEGNIDEVRSKLEQ